MSDATNDSSDTTRNIRIATRASKLARWQADWVGEQLTACGHTVELVFVSTHGDRDQHSSIGSLSMQGVFTKQVQQAVLDGDADVAVHSLKDLPTADIPGLVIAAVPPRADNRDAVACTNANNLATLHAGARIGTSSVRRHAQMLRLRPDVQPVPLRGNVDSRLKKLDEGEVDAILLAAAGLNRLGFGNRIAFYLQPPDFLPAPGQGALAIECRQEDESLRKILAPLEHEPTRTAVNAERGLLATLEAGCLAPVGAIAEVREGRLELHGRVLSIDGRRAIDAAATAAINNFGAAVKQVADELVAKGASELIAAARHQ